MRLNILWRLTGWDFYYEIQLSEQQILFLDNLYFNIMSVRCDRFLLISFQLIDGFLPQLAIISCHVIPFDFKDSIHCLQTDGINGYSIRHL